MASGPITSWQIDGEPMENIDRLYFPGLQNHCRWQVETWNWKMLAPWRKSYDKPRQYRKADHFAYKGLYGQSYGFSISHV